MGVLGVSHIAVGVRDMERSLEFYRDVVGLVVSLDVMEDIAASGTMEATKRRGVYLHADNERRWPFIVLDTCADRPPFGSPAVFWQVGIHHFAFHVDDIDAVAARADDYGFERVLGPSAGSDSAGYGEPPGRTVRSMFLKDPDGTLVQFDERVD